ncbi:MAG: hypothetical protein RBR22_05675 [Desulfuromonas sp.]|nr:hypothetical protein [Desulfuromonas sp.]
MQRLSLLLITLMLTSVLGLPVAAQANGPMYTAYNMWYEAPHQMSAINYKRGSILPAGTLVKNIAIYTEEFSPHKYISFRRVSDNQSFKVHFRSKFHPGKTIEDYRQMMFSRQSFQQQTANMSEREINAIIRGVLVTGMSKEAVRLSYGVPPQHRTPTLDANIWRYWTSRMVSKDVCFDMHGRTIRCNTSEVL